MASSSKYNSMPYDHYYCTDWQPIFPTSITAPDLNRQSSSPITLGVFLSVYGINIAFAEPYTGDKYWDQPVPKTASQVDPRKPITCTSTTSTSEIAVGIDAVRRKRWKIPLSFQLHPKNAHLLFPTMVLGPTRSSAWGMCSLIYSVGGSPLEGVRRKVNKREW
jgi:hypothetical protein